MKNVMDYLQKCGTDIFERDEINEPLTTTYLIIHRAVRDHADILLVHPNYIKWHKDSKQIGEFTLAEPIFIRSFPSMMEQIIERDQMVNDLLKLISTENNITKYKIQLAPG
ncbi:hypothetical protein ANAEL_05777 [Anaerolineales bacterium]|nr:hypothetical protein ANAEL_05777 [Anaerolineales bacterium]